MWNNEKKCRICKTRFDATRYSQVFCSTRCSSIWYRLQKDTAKAARPSLPPQRCKACRAEFVPKHRGTNYCSKACRPSTQMIPPPCFPGISTGTVGAITELAVCQHLLSDGYAVFRSVSPSALCDLVAIRGSTIRLFEVRTGRRSYTGAPTFPRKVHRPVPNLEFAIYFPTEGDFLFIAATDSVGNLVEPPQNSEAVEP
jgi:hypothetical protein